MRVGIATDHGGFGLKEELIARLRAAGHEIVDFGAHTLECRTTTIPTSSCRSRRPWSPDRSSAAWRSAAAASARRSAPTKSPGIRAALIHDHFSAKQGVEDDHLNILCMGGRTVGPAVAWDLVQTFLAAEFSQADRHLRRLGESGAHWKRAATATHD